MSETLYKVLQDNGQTPYGTGVWSLPTDDQHSDWMPAMTGKLIPCENGYHLCRREDLVSWLGPHIYTAEYRGERIDDDDKIVVREARLLALIVPWNERSARLFACDCATHVWPLFEQKNPTDSRPRNCIEIARKFAIGNATANEMDAARAADRDWETSGQSVRSMGQ